MKKMFFVVFAFFIISYYSVPSNAYEENLDKSENPFPEYKYSITPDSDDWNDYSVKEKVEMLRIPDEELSSMTNDELISAIYNYPYLIDI